MIGPALLRTTRARIVLVVLAQTLALGAIVGARALTLATGREMVVKTEPVDPTDLFRGDYVALGYPMSRLEPGGLAGDRDFAPGERVFVTLSPKGDDWVTLAVSHHAPPPGRFGPETRTLRATVDYVYEAPARTGADGEATPPCPAPCTTLRLTYGIESYFVPEGTGGALEAERNQKRVAVVLAVRGDGRAAIKALQIDGKTIAREGLF